MNTNLVDIVRHLISLITLELSVVSIDSGKVYLCNTLHLTLDKIVKDEFGNEYQRHCSGWFIHEFEGHGYTVHGTTGTRYLRGYMAGPRYGFPGCLLLDEALTLVLRINRKPKHAFNLLAVKDVRGVPARHKREAQP